MKTNIKPLKLPIAVIGLGISGSAALRLLKNLQIPAHQIASFDDKQEADYKDPAALMDQFKPQTLLVSPGYPLASAWIQDAIKKGVHIVSELSISTELLTSEKVIGITGSVGKSTTVSLLGAALEKWCGSYFVGGNLGVPISTYVSDVLEGLRKPAEWIVLELSSYQLENCNGLLLEHSGITYFTSNHLERYPSIQEYYATKWNIANHTKGKLVINGESKDLFDWLQKPQSNEQSAILDSHQKVLVSRIDDVKFLTYALDRNHLIGRHNLENIVLAANLINLCGWPEIAYQGLRSFGGLPHRLENLGVHKGVQFINDSKATAMDSVITAFRSASENLLEGDHIYCLLGGKDKNLPWEQLSSLGENKNARFIFFGQCGELAQKKSGLVGAYFSSLKTAVPEVMKMARENDIVLLSPGGTSLDEFKSFEDRGNQFKKMVEDFAKD